VQNPGTMKRFFKKVVSYLKDSYNELVHKVSWPTAAELSSSAIVVLTASLIIALIVFLIDLGFDVIMTFIYEKVF
jgi:preprotein translocase subunit SecE